VRRASQLYRHSISLIFASFLGALAASAEDVPPTFEAVVSVAEQKLVVLRNGEMVVRYPISTSRFGIGDNFGSYKTPLGRMRVCDKIGDNFAPGTVIRHREATREVLPANAPGRDPIVTRIIWLDGCEPQNAHAHARGIYIHGTTEENYLGRPMSWGCIRMRSADVISLFDQLPVNSSVTIIPDRLPHYTKYDARREAILLAKKEKEQQQQLLQQQMLLAQQHPAAVPTAPVPIAAVDHPPATKSGGRETLLLPVATPAPERNIAAAAPAEPPAPPKPPLHLATSSRGVRDVVTTQSLTTVSTTTFSHAKSEMVDAMRGSILYSGLGNNGNSEIPRLGQ
jgi:hypothetical protein